MKGLRPASIAISLLTLAAAMWASPARAQPPMVPFKLYITELWQLDDIQDIGIGVIGDFYANVTINGVGQSNKQGGDGACDDTTSTGLIVPLRLFRNFDRIPDCHVKTPWAFSQQVPAGQPVHVKIQIFDTDAIFDDEADLKVGDGDAIEFDVDPATGKWSGDINWPQNCSRPGLNLGGNNANVCWQASFDTDNDGLLDVWEKFGVDTNNDGIIDLDLPALGANPLRKDVFIETDYLAAPNHSHGPRKDAIDRIVASFANAPIPNPDGTSGVQLHVDVGNLYGTGGFFSVVGPGGAVLQTRSRPSITAPREIRSSPSGIVLTTPLFPADTQIPSLLTSARELNETGPQRVSPSSTPFRFQSTGPKPSPPAMPMHSSRERSSSGGGIAFATLLE